MRRNEHRDDRNYIREAEQLIKGLSVKELYKLFEIVVEEQRGFQKPERRKELDAVMEVIKRHPRLEEGRLAHIERGPSEMARHARAKDGNTIKHKKKA